MFDYEPRSGYVVWPRSFEKLPKDIRKIMRHLLYKATWDKRDSRSLEIGQVEITIDQISSDVDGLEITPKQVRNRIEKMVKNELITYQGGSSGIPSIITIVGYDTHQNTANYGKQLVNNREIKGKQKVSYLPNDINNLALERETKGKQKVNKRESKGQPYQNIKHKDIKHNIKTEPEIGSLLDDLKNFCKKRIVLFPDDKRIFKTYADDTETINLLLEKHNRSKVKYYWELFFIDPTIEGDIEATVFYKSKPATLPLFVKWIELAEKDQPKLNVFKKIRETK